MGVAAGNGFVETGIADSGSNDEFVVAAGTSLVIAGTEFVTELDGLFVDVVCATGSCVAAGALVVSACWLQPYSNKPASALAAVIWIFRNNFIFFIPSN
jgi:hypothetical protein